MKSCPRIAFFERKLMKKIRLIASDLDGTLLNQEKMISNRNIEAIRRCKEKGIHFGIATGRPVDTTKVMVQRWGVEKEIDFIMGMNGGIIFDCKSNQSDLYYPLEGKTIQEIIRFFEGYDVIFHVKIGRNRYTNVSTKKTQEDAKRVGEDEVLMDLIPFLEDKKVSKLNVISEPSYQMVVKERAQKFIESHPTVTGFPTQPDIFEFVDYRINKGFGLEKLAEHYKISIDETLAFGDAENDICLIQAAGKGICMRNGADKTKEIADYVTPYTNQEDAVARYLEENILK